MLRLSQKTAIKHTAKITSKLLKQQKNFILPTSFGKMQKIQKKLGRP
jgi:hypothetical protein